MRAERVASRMEFHGLSEVGAERLLGHDYGSVVAGVSANAAASVARCGVVSFAISGTMKRWCVVLMVFE